MTTEELALLKSLSRDLQKTGAALGMLAMTFKGRDMHSAARYLGKSLDYLENADKHINRTL